MTMLYLRESDESRLMRMRALGTELAGVHTGRLAGERYQTWPQTLQVLSWAFYQGSVAERETAARRAAGLSYSER